MSVYRTIGPLDWLLILEQLWTFFHLSDKNRVLGTWYDELKNVILKEAFGTTKKYSRGVKAKFTIIKHNANN